MPADRLLTTNPPVVHSAFRPRARQLLAAIAVSLSCIPLAQAQDFELSASPESLQICTPGNAIYSVNVSSLARFSEPVALSTAGEPGSTSSGFSINPVIPPGASTLTISNTGAAVPGHYSVTINGTSSPSAFYHETSVKLHVASLAPGQTTLRFPPDAAAGTLLRPSLIWDAVAQTANYTVQVSESPIFDTLLLTTTTTAPGFNFPDPLEPDTTYFWRVRAENGCGAQSYSAASSFTTGTIDADPYPVDPDFGIQIYPEQEETCMPDDAQILVGIASFNDYPYTVSLATESAPEGTSSGFDVNPVFPPAVSLLSISNTGNASQGVYLIDVRGYGVLGTTYFKTFGLTLFSTPPASTSLISPANGATDVALLPYLSWSASDQASLYHLEVSESSRFETFAFVGTSGFPGLLVSLPLDPNTMYYWRVQPENACGVQAFSAPFVFTTTGQPVPKLIFANGFE